MEKLRHPLNFHNSTTSACNDDDYVVHDELMTMSLMIVQIAFLIVVRFAGDSWRRGKMQRGVFSD